MNSKEIEFKLREQEEFIQLIQLLKAMNIAESGAVASQMVVACQVRVNGQVETRKRKKLFSGDTVEVYAEKIHII